jgi:ubiquinone/menaquinone biosynthesis C-methylase UbiE
VREREAREFIASAVGESGGVWADVGAGTGTFTRALRSLLAPGSRIYAVDNDPTAIDALQKFGSNVIPIRADFSQAFKLPETALDGILAANALHFVPDPDVVLARLVRLLKPGGRVVIVEYDRRAASPWVPYPVASDRWPELATRAGLENPRITARRKSRYAGELYVAAAELPGGDQTAVVSTPAVGF